MSKDGEFNSVVAPAAGFDPNSTGLKPSAKRMKPFGLRVWNSFSPKGFILLAVGFSPVLLIF